MDEFEDEVMNDEMTKKAMDEVTGKYEAKVNEESIRQAEADAEKLQSNSRLQKIWDKVQLMFEIAKHPKVWGKKVALIVGAALLYLVSPVDVIPDLIPVLGYADDCAVLLAVLNRISASVRQIAENNPSFFLSMLPEKLRPVAMSCFNLDPAMFYAEENTAPVIESDFEYAKEPIAAAPRITRKEVKPIHNYNLYLGLYGGAGRIYDKYAEYCENAEKNGKTRTLGYRIRKSLMTSLENKIYTVLDYTVIREFQDELDVKSRQKFSKDLIAFLCFAIGIAAFRMTESGIAFAYVSAFFLAVSFCFFAVALLKGIRLVFRFLFKGISIHSQYPEYTFTECGIFAVVTNLFRLDPEICRKALDSSLENRRFSRNILRIVYKLFNNSILRLIFNMLLISAGICLMKVVATNLHYNVTPLEMMILPFRMIIGG